MTLWQSLAAYTLAAGLLTVAPGVDSALVLRTAAVEGSRRATAAMIGICLGCLIWGAAAALGLGALLAASETAYTIVKWTGAAYLVWLGIGMWRDPGTISSSTPTASAKRGGWLSRGLLTNILNPKVGVFYITFLPQFVPTGYPVAAFCFLLAVLHVLLTLMWQGALIAACVPLGRFLVRRRVVQTINRVTGTILIGLGAKLAASR